MKISVEISLYPLRENYEAIILDFIRELNEYEEDIIVETNGMSTQIFGEYDQVMLAIHEPMKKVYEQHQAVLILKMGRGTLR